ncbi:MAG: hypothetical protein H6734_17205 [Alphaproteobacteria bacterium]|nr:hypothetical protein [Alphaproteobacteria bacterium]
MFWVFLGSISAAQPAGDLTITRLVGALEARCGQPISLEHREHSEPSGLTTAQVAAADCGSLESWLRVRFEPACRWHVTTFDGPKLLIRNGTQASPCQPLASALDAAMVTDGWRDEDKLEWRNAHDVDTFGHDGWPPENYVGEPTQIARDMLLWLPDTMSYRFGPPLPLIVEGVRKDEEYNSKLRLHTIGDRERGRAYQIAPPVPYKSPWTADERRRLDALIDDEREGRISAETFYTAYRAIAAERAAREAQTP